MNENDINVIINQCGERDMDIKRDKYLNDLINRMHNGMIKVVTGIRRSGKSYLLFNIFKKYLLEQGINDSHIITIELDKRSNNKYRDPDVILEYIESKLIYGIEKNEIKKCNTNLTAFVIYKVFISIMFEYKNDIDENKVTSEVINILKNGLLN